MQISDLKKYRAFFFAALAVIAAAAIRQIGYHVNEQLNLFCIILRTSVYIGLFAAWGISVSNRIIQPQVRRYLVAISLLVGFWIAIRGDQVFIGYLRMADALSLVFVLSAHAVYSAAGAVRGCRTGEVGSSAFIKVDEFSIYSYRRAAAFCTDQ